jgi:hypothetical protein
MPEFALPAILDVEASGFGRGSYPIEIGFIKPQGQSFCSLIHPLPDWKHWDDEAESLHGITRDLLLRHGKPPEWVAAEMNARLRGLTVYCDGWGQDYPWLARLYDSADLQPAFRLEDLRRLLSEDEAARWHQVISDVRREQNVCRHRASTDAKVLQLALLRVREKAADARAS